VKATTVSVRLPIYLWSYSIPTGFFWHCCEFSNDVWNTNKLSGAVAGDINLVATLLSVNSSLVVVTVVVFVEIALVGEMLWIVVTPLFSKWLSTGFTRLVLTKCWVICSLTCPFWISGGRLEECLVDWLRLCETWVPLGPHRPGSRPSPTSGSSLLEDLPTCQWTQPT
jgi:hypothetical protein